MDAVVSQGKEPRVKAELAHVARYTSSILSMIHSIALCQWQATEALQPTSEERLPAIPSPIPRRPTRSHSQRLMQHLTTAPSNYRTAWPWKAAVLEQRQSQERLSTAGEGTVTCRYVDGGVVGAPMTRVVQLRCSYGREGRDSSVWQCMHGCGTTA